jgi:hypothetical protein
MNTLERAIDIRISGENYDNATRVDRPDSLNDRVSVSRAFDVEVANQNVESATPHGFQCFRYGGGYVDQVAVPLQDAWKRCPDIRFVVNEQNSLG